MTNFVFVLRVAVSPGRPKLLLMAWYMTSVACEVVTFWLSKHAIVVITRSKLSPPVVASVEIYFFSGIISFFVFSSFVLV